MKHIFSKYSILALVLILNVGQLVLASELPKLQTSISKINKGLITAQALPVLKEQLAENPDFFTKQAVYYQMTLKFLKDSETLLAELQAKSNDPQKMEAFLVKQVINKILQLAGVEEPTATTEPTSLPKKILRKILFKDLFKTDDGKLARDGYRVDADKSIIIDCLDHETDAKYLAKQLEMISTDIKKARIVCTEVLWLLNSTSQYMPDDLKNSFENAIKAEAEKGKSLVDYLDEFLGKPNPQEENIPQEQALLITT